MKRLPILALLVGASVIAWHYWRQGQVGPLVVSGFVEADEIRVGSRVGGRVSHVAVSEGQTVRTGDTLLTIDPFDLQERLAEAAAMAAAARAEHARLSAGFRREEIEQARARRDRAAATLAKLVAGPRSKEIDIAREDVKAAEADVEFAESEYSRIMQLREGASAGRTEVDAAVRSRKASRAQLEAASQRLALLVEGSRQEDVAEARAVFTESEQALKLMESGSRTEDTAAAASRLAAAEARVAEIERQIGELSLESPCDCVVEAVDLQPGDLVSANGPAMSLLDVSKLWVRAYVPESRLGRVRLGQEVRVGVDSFPGEFFPAMVTFIAREAEFTPRNVQTPEERSKQVFRMKVTLSKGHDRLRVGMAADVHLEDDATGGE